MSLLIFFPFKVFISFSKHYRDFPRLGSQKECARLWWFFLSSGLNSKSTGPWTATVYEQVIFVVSDVKRIKTFHCPRISEREDRQREEETGRRCHIPHPNASFPWGACPSSFLPGKLSLTQQAGNGWPCGFHCPGFQVTPSPRRPSPEISEKEGFGLVRGHCWVCVCVERWAGAGGAGEECLRQTEALCLLSFYENWVTFVNSKYWFRGPLPSCPPPSGQHPKLPCTYTQLQLFLPESPLCSRDVRVDSVVHNLGRKQQVGLKLAVPFNSSLKFSPSPLFFFLVLFK